MTILLFALSQAALVLFGLPAAFLPGARQLPWPGRISCAYAAGALLLTLAGILFSAAGWKWTYPALAIPLLVVSCIGTLLLRKHTSERRARVEMPALVAAAALLVCSGAVFVLLQAVGSGRSISVDLVIFWGIKAARFAQAGALDIPFLKWVYATHTHSNYPPLFPMTVAWSALNDPQLVWKVAPFSTAVWFILAIPLLFGCLRQRMTDGAAAATTAFWSVALAAGISHAFSGGNAEATLVFYETAAIATLLFLPQRRWSDGVLPGLFLAGAVLTKLEGIVGSSFILLGTVLAIAFSRRWKEWKPLATAALLPFLAGLAWISFMIVKEIPAKDPTHVQFTGIVLDHFEAVIAGLFLNSSFGTRGLSWALPLVVVIILAERWSSRAVMPLTFAAGLPLFTTFHYLQSATDPTVQIGWTFSRLMLPAVSALILTAGVLLFEQLSSRQSESSKNRTEESPHSLQSPALVSASSHEA